MDLQQELRARGYRLTPQRQLVLEAVTDLGHATPEDTHAWVQQRSSGVSLSTVYRTLEVLEEIGLVKHAHLSHGSPTYHAADHSDHVHLVCRDCGTIMSIPPDEIQSMFDVLRDRRGFEVDVSHLAIFGRCRTCEESSP